jgi:hypothetical protein
LSENQLRHALGRHRLATKGRPLTKVSVFIEKARFRISIRLAARITVDEV